VERPLELSPRLRWWPSTLWQTTTLEIERDGVRLMVDPGIAPWEVRSAAAGRPVDHVLITHADWDHVLGRLAFSGASLGVAETTAARLRAEPGDAQRKLRAFDEDDYVSRPRPLSLGQEIGRAHV